MRHHALHEPSEVPIRLFKSGFLEFFSHIHPAVVLIVWLPVVAYCAFLALVDPTLNGPQIGAAFAAGILVWSLTEYVLHRYVFHFQPHNPGPLLKRILFLFHGVHHTQPQCKTRLVMPPVVSVPLGIFFYSLFALTLGQYLGVPNWIAPTFAGFVTGYIAYDMLHYAVHHFTLRNRVLAALKQHHMQHHYRTPELRFGVSSTLWDVVFGTLHERKA